MIKIENIKIDYNDKLIVDNFSLNVDCGEIVALVGKSGAGKSTILYSIAMLKEIKSGEILINGNSLPKLNSKESERIFREEIGFIFQNYLLVNDKTVRENLEIVKYSDDYSVEEALNFVGMSEYVDYNISELSGGQQQRIAFARLFMKPFNILLGDEITGSLDQTTKFEIMDLVIKLKEQGKAILLVTHDPDIAKYADREVVIGE